MVQSVELLLSPEAEYQVNEQWSALVAAGLPSQARHTGATNRPHVTLAVARQLDPDQESAIGAAAADSLPVALRLGGLLVFGPAPFVLSRLVVPTVELLDLQRRVLDAIGPTSESFRHQEPGRWTGHVTLARRLTADQLADAVQVLSPAADVDGRAVAIRRWDGGRKVAWTVASTPAAGDQPGDAPIRMPMT